MTLHPHSVSDVFIRPHRIRTYRDEDCDLLMAQRTTLDAMIPREDFAVSDGEYALDLFPGFPISYLANDSAILKLLRKPDFQRETNHWTSEQFCTFIASFLDNEVIPSLILWKSPKSIFVIDGGHRLSALRAWMEDDYGDGPHSHAFYNGEIPDEQKKIAMKTRRLVERTVGKYATLKQLVGSKAPIDISMKRAQTMVTRAVSVQWIQGDAAVAETSFFKINTQGTPLDEIEEMLIRNRRKAISISARAILRAGTGHEYWSKFKEETRGKIVSLAYTFYQLMFEPEMEQPVKTLDLPLGGSISPVDALAMLIEFLAIAGTKDGKPKNITEYLDDENGDETVDILTRSIEIVRYITGNGPQSLGLHPAIYFYNDRGKYSRFLFLGVTLLITERVRNNDSGFFRKFTMQREKIEAFLMANRSLIGILLQNMSKASRVVKMRDLFAFLISEFQDGREVQVIEMIQHLGMRGKIYDVVAAHTSTEFTDDTVRTRNRTERV